MQTKLTDARLHIHLGEQKSIVVPEDHRLHGNPTFVSSDERALLVRPHPGDPNMADLTPKYETSNGAAVTVTILGEPAEVAEPVKAKKGEEAPEPAPEPDEVIQNVLVTIGPAHPAGHDVVHLVDTPGVERKKPVASQKKK